MQGLLAVMWLLAPGADGAAQPAVYKCADGQGGHLYQSMPCAVGATLRRWDIPPASVHTGFSRDTRKNAPQNSNNSFGAMT